MTGLHIRPATPADQPWIVALAPRLHEFGPPPFRPVAQMDAAVAEELAAAFVSPPPGSAILVAERTGDGAPLGFIYLMTMADYFTGEDHAHVSDVIVRPEGEGQGIGRALLAAAEDWARAQGFRLITLNVFPGNERPRALYEKIGYAPDTLKMVKELS